MTDKQKIFWNKDIPNAGMEYMDPAHISYNSKPYQEPYYTHQNTNNYNYNLLDRNQQINVLQNRVIRAGRYAENAPTLDGENMLRPTHKNSNFKQMQPTSELAFDGTKTTLQNRPNINFRMQYKQLQEEKLKMQLQTQSEALLQQQQTFALRQQLNPPFPNSPSIQRSIQGTAIDFSESSYQFPDSTSLMRTPASFYENVMKKNFIQYSDDPANNKSPTESRSFNGITSIRSPRDEIIIQQNHPGLVVNQACQTQMSGDTSGSGSSSKSPPQGSPFHTSSGSSGGKGQPTQLKSPIAKRVLNAPITISGWLHKQGSDGLKVWRRRWFVLSEFCLFYYKSPEEDKVLGSILLPSYTISVCTAKDKTNRKYAFKCEHQNMRTYWLAAESFESMKKWINALTRASIMQCNSYPFDGSLDNKKRLTAATLANKTDKSVNNLLEDPSENNSPSIKQPLYANAPPKPRRAAGEMPDTNVGDFLKFYNADPSNIHFEPKPTINDYLLQQKTYKNRNSNVKDEFNDVQRFMEQTYQSEMRKGFDSKAAINDEIVLTMRKHQQAPRTPESYGFSLKKNTFSDERYSFPNDSNSRGQYTLPRPTEESNLPKLQSISAKVPNCFFYLFENSKIF